MAIAGRWMAAHFNQPGFEDLIDFNVYALCGDGCMMEGISAEAASLAGHLRLSNLCWIYDNNHITIEGHTALAFSDDVATRFIGHGWNVTRVGDANDQEMLARAFHTFLERRDRPTLIIVDSHIAYGAPHKQDTSAAHGEPLGEDEIRLTKRNYGWPEDAKFYVPDGVYDHFRNRLGKRGKELRDAWFSRVPQYRAEYPELAEQLYRMQHRQLPEGWDKDVPTFRGGRQGGGDAGCIRARCSTPWGRQSRGCWAVRPTWRPRPRRGSRSTGPATSSPTVPAGATCTSAFASTPWPRCSTAWPWSRCGPTVPPS